MRFFYGLYVEDKTLGAALDLIRFLAEPNFFRRAHITVRGPYTQKIAEEISEIGKGKTYKIYFAGVSSFFEPSQNTVFLKCDVPGIEQVWSKPDFGNQITPHITFYDGRERNIAYGIFNAMRKHSWNFSANSSALVEIEAKSAPEKYLQEFQIHQRIHEEVLGRTLDYKQLRTLDWRTRVSYIDWVANFIDRRYSMKQA